MTPSRFVADLHVHSSFSRATSPKLLPGFIELWARRKGLNLVGSGDLSHPGWLARLRSELVDAPEEGFFMLSPAARASFLAGEGRGEWAPPESAPLPRFVLSGEISTIYKADGRVRKVHHVVLLPSFEAAEAFQRSLERVGNIRSDGRPILGLDSRDLFEILLGADERAILIPAHIWTPWFSVLGEKSGFDRVEDCYRDLSPRIGAVETGLSSNPPMNWALSSLDRYVLVSNSDAHSPENLGREANRVEGEFSYPGLFDALGPASAADDSGVAAEGTTAQARARVAGTLEFFPEEGKYHYDGHRACKVVLSPEEADAASGLCPVCGRPLTGGVLHRVAALADRPIVERQAWIQEFSGTRRRPYSSLVPLRELLGEILGTGPTSKKVEAAYSGLVSAAGSELDLLESCPPEEAARAAKGYLPGELLAESLARVRSGRVIVQPGYDGEYGVIKVFTKGELESAVSTLFALGSPESATVPKGKAAPLKPRRTSANAPATPLALVGEGQPRPPASIGPGRHLALTPEQEEAASLGVGTRARAALVIAGPGSGKTALLVERMARLVEAGAEPESILALTFTAKAAAELASRLGARLSHQGDGGARLPAALTFHAFASLLMQGAAPGTAARKGQAELFEEAAPSSGAGLVLVEGGERDYLLEAACLGSGLREGDSKRLGRYIEERKRLLARPGEPIARGSAPLGGLPPREEGLDVDGALDAGYAAYEAALAKAGAIDFDGLLLEATLRLAGDEKFAKEARRRWSALLVDEYQDVNYAQYALVRLLAPGGDFQGPFAIGDPDQAIYGFRGADPRFIARFVEDYPEAAVFRLSKSFRCPPVVLEASARVVKRDGSAVAADDAGAAGPLILRAEAPTARAEAEWMARRMEGLLGGTSLFSFDSGVVGGLADSEDDADGAGGASPGDIAVLLRLADAAAPIEAALRDHGIPFRSLGERPWWLEPRPAAVIALLRAATDKRRLPFLPPGQRPLAIGLAEGIAAISKADASPEAAIAAATNLAIALLSENGLLPKADGAGEMSDLDKLRGRFKEASKDVDGLDAFLESLRGDLPQEDFAARADRVAIMTIHASKGLEFPYVFLPCLEEGILPFTLFGTSAARLAEERRLLYVGMTRAKRRLFLSSARARAILGREVRLEPSSFLGSLGEDLAELVAAEPPPRPRDPQLSLF